MTARQIVRDCRIAVAPAGLVLAVLVAMATASPAGAIHRGYDVPFGSYRFMVSLRLAETPGSHRCGGMLVKPDIVLTAAHCVARVRAGGLVAVVGADVPEWPKAPRISTLGHRVPETFDFRVDNRDDIAVVRLVALQDTPGIRLAASEPRVGARVVTAGWGCTNAPPVCRVRAVNLRASGQTVLRDASCGRDVFWTRPTYNARTNICTRGTRARSTINRGDSGGPLLVRDRGGAFRLVGVTALGSDSTTKLYAGFTSIPVRREMDRSRHPVVAGELTTRKSGRPSSAGATGAQTAQPASFAGLRALRAALVEQRLNPEAWSELAGLLPPGG